MRYWIITNLTANSLLLLSMIIIFIIWGSFWIAGIETSIEEGEGYFLLFSFSILGMMILIFLVLFIVTLSCFLALKKLKRGETIGTGGKIFQAAASMTALYLLIILITDVLFRQIL